MMPVYRKKNIYTILKFTKTDTGYYIMYSFAVFWFKTFFSPKNNQKGVAFTHMTSKGAFSAKCKFSLESITIPRNYYYFK